MVGFLLWGWKFFQWWITTFITFQSLISFVFFFFFFLIFLIYAWSGSISGVGNFFNGRFQTSSPFSGSFLSSSTSSATGGAINVNVSLLTYSRACIYIF